MLSSDIVGAPVIVPVGSLLKVEDLDQLVAPIALYLDTLFEGGPLWFK